MENDEARVRRESETDGWRRRRLGPGLILIVVGLRRPCANSITPFGIRCEVAHDDFCIAVLRNERVRDELAVSGKPLRLNGAPTVVIAVRECALRGALLRRRWVLEEQRRGYGDKQHVP